MKTLKICPSSRYNSRKDQFDYINKKICEKNTVSKIKRQVVNWEKYKCNTYPLFRKHSKIEKSNDSYTPKNISTFKCVNFIVTSFSINGASTTREPRTK